MSLQGSNAAVDDDRPNDTPADDLHDANGTPRGQRRGPKPQGDTVNAGWSTDSRGNGQGSRQGKHEQDGIDPQTPRDIPKQAGDTQNSPVNSTAGGKGQGQGQMGETGQEGGKTCQNGKRKSTGQAKSQVEKSLSRTHGAESLDVGRERPLRANGCYPDPPESREGIPRPPVRPIYHGVEWWSDTLQDAAEWVARTPTAWTLVRFLANLGVTAHALEQAVDRFPELTDLDDMVRDLIAANIAELALSRCWDARFAQFTLSARHGWKEISVLESQGTVQYSLSCDFARPGQQPPQALSPQSAPLSLPLPPGADRRVSIEDGRTIDIDASEPVMVPENHVQHALGATIDTRPALDDLGKTADDAADKDSWQAYSKPHDVDVGQGPEPIKYDKHGQVIPPAAPRVPKDKVVRVEAVRVAKVPHVPKIRAIKVEVPRVPKPIGRPKGKKDTKPRKTRSDKGSRKGETGDGGTGPRPHGGGGGIPHIGIRPATPSKSVENPEQQHP